VFLVLVKEVRETFEIEENSEKLFNEDKTALPTKNFPKHIDAERERKAEILQW
jgi:hypothetical protein